MALLKSMSRAQQRQVDLTTAVCQERLLATHVRHVLGLVGLVAEQLPFDDALDIYVRILRLPPEQARNIGSRALAEIGRHGGLSVEDAEREAQQAQQARRAAEQEEERGEEDGGERGEGRSGALFSRLRRRVRGRVQDDLRYRINLAAARAEDAILETHVQNALVFVRALGEETSDPDAVELYLETMMLPEGVADVIYNRALRILADQALPELPAMEEERTSPEAAARAVEQARSAS